MKNELRYAQLDEAGNLFRIWRKNDLTQTESSMDLPVTMEQLKVFAAGYPGPSIQDIFPHLTPDQREFLKTGITPEYWDELFKEKPNDS